MSKNLFSSARTVFSSVRHKALFMGASGGHRGNGVGKEWLIFFYGVGARSMPATGCGGTFLRDTLPEQIFC